MRTISVILIDPAARTVAVADSTGTLEHLRQLVQADHLEVIRVDGGSDVMLCAEEPKPGAQPFQIGSAVIRGRAVIVGVRGEDHISARTPVEGVRGVVAFAH